MSDDMNFFNLKTPCGQCPFRTDNGFILTNERVEEITGSLMAGKSFACHKTVDYSDEGERTTYHDGEMHCAGALIMLEHENKPNQIMRIGERLRFYDHKQLKMDAPVFKSVKDMILAYRQRNAGTQRKRKNV